MRSHMLSLLIDSPRSGHAARMSQNDAPLHRLLADEVLRRESHAPATLLGMAKQLLCKTALLLHP